MTRAMIIAARRSAVMPTGGAFHALDIHELAVPVIGALLDDAGVARGDVEELILSNALGAGGNPARVTALAAELPQHVAGLSVDRQCVGGLDAILLAKAMVGSGQHDVVIAGGAESYSRRPLRARRGDGGSAEFYQRPAFTPWPDRDPDMAKAAAVLAQADGITREAQDDWAVQSHQTAIAASERMSRSEIVSVLEQSRDGFARQLTPRTCARAKPIVDTVTAANTAVEADGAAFCLVVSDRVARQLDRPLVEIVAGSTLGSDPVWPGRAPIAAIEAALAATGLSPRALQAVEIMEAYAAQAIVCVNGAGLDPERVNRGGGALARGHPIGASGAILAVRLYHELASSGGTGLAAIAAAGGLGTAMVVRRADQL